MHDPQRLATNDQVRYLRLLCEKLSLDEDDVLEEYAPGTMSLEELTVPQASQMIDELKALQR